MTSCPICSSALPAQPVKHCPSCQASFVRASPFAAVKEGLWVLAIWLALAAATLLWEPLTGAPSPEALFSVWGASSVACACWLLWVTHRSSMRRLDALAEALKQR